LPRHAEFLVVAILVGFTRRVVGPAPRRGEHRRRQERGDQQYTLPVHIGTPSTGKTVRAPVLNVNEPATEGESIPGSSAESSAESSCRIILGRPRNRGCVRAIRIKGSLPPRAVVHSSPLDPDAA